MYVEGQQELMVYAFVCFADFVSTSFIQGHFAHFDCKYH